MSSPVNNRSRESSPERSPGVCLDSAVEDSSVPHMVPLDFWQVICSYLRMPDALSLACTNTHVYRSIGSNPFYWTTSIKKLHPVIYEKLIKTPGLTPIDLCKQGTELIQKNIFRNVDENRCPFSTLLDLGINVCDFKKQKGTSLVYVAKDNGELSIWDYSISKCEPIAILGEHESVFRLEICPPYAATYCENGVLMVWDLEKRQRIGKIEKCWQFEIQNDGKLYTVPVSSSSIETRELSNPEVVIECKDYSVGKIDFFAQYKGHVYLMTSAKRLFCQNLSSGVREEFSFARPLDELSEMRVRGLIVKNGYITVFGEAKQNRSLGWPLDFRYYKDLKSSDEDWKRCQYELCTLGSAEIINGLFYQSFYFNDPVNGQLIRGLSFEENTKDYNGLASLSDKPGNKEASVDYFQAEGTDCFTHSLEDGLFKLWQLDAPCLSSYPLDTLQSTLKSLETTETVIKERAPLWLEKLPIPEFQHCLETYSLRYNGCSTPSLDVISRVKTLVCIQHLFHELHRIEKIKYNATFIDSIGKYIDLCGSHTSRLWEILRFNYEIQLDDVNMRQLFCQPWGYNWSMLHSNKLEALQQLQSELEAAWAFEFPAFPELGLNCEKDYQELGVTQAMLEKLNIESKQDIINYGIQWMEFPLCPPLTEQPTKREAQLTLASEWKAIVDSLFEHSTRCGMEESAERAKVLLDKLVAASYSPQGLRKFFQENDSAQFVQKINELIDNFHLQQKGRLRGKFASLS